MVFVSSAAVANVTALASWADIKVLGTTWAFAAVNGLAAGVITFLINTAEDSTSLNLGPRG
jgi:hypothetical protein